MINYGYIVKTSILALGLIAFGLAPAATALAEPQHNNHQNRHSFNNHGNHHSFNRHGNRHFRHGGGHGFRHHGGHGGDVFLGVLAGGLLYYGLTANRRDYSYDRNYYRNYNRKVYVQQQPVYAQPSQQNWTSQAPVQPQIEPTKSPCLQIREYQTTITVGDQTVAAYGQSCLMPDGTWKLGPAYPEPDFGN